MGTRALILRAVLIASKLKNLAIALLLVATSACNCSPRGAGSAPTVKTPKGPSPEPTKPGAPEIALPDVPAADPREPIITAAVAQLLQRHLRTRPIDDALGREAMGYYIERLDPAKHFLLKPQVEALRAQADQLDAQLASVDLRLARLGTAILTQQRKKVADIVARLTSKPFDLSDAETFETDPDKRDFVANDAALEDLWRRNLEQQVLGRMQRMREASEAQAEAKTKTKTKTKGAKAEADTPPDEATAAPDEELPTTDAGREKKARRELAEALAGRFERYADSTPLEAIETFLNALAAAYGPHTMFMAPDDKANFDIQMTGSLEGIGAVLSEGDHLIEVREIVPGGAAWRDGELEAGDLILSVAQEGEDPVDVADMRISEAVKMIRGPKGTLVTLSIRKPDGRVVSIVIKRDVVVVEATYARGALLRLDKRQAPVGYVYLPNFYGNTREQSGAAPERNATADVRALLGQLDKRQVDTVVLDLRGNGGGLLSEATGVAGLFIESGPLVQVQSADGELQVLSDDNDDVAFDGRLLVLVDRLSASASEIVAGALQDYGRALVVGTGPTHGKGTVQMLASLDRMVKRSPGPLGVLKLTTQQFFLVDGESTQQRGVQPDILLPDPLAHLEIGERYLPNPVPFSKIDKLPFEPWSGPGWDAAKLVESSRRRAQGSEVFARIEARGEYLEQLDDDTLVPLELEAWVARQQAQRTALEAFEEDEQDPPARLSAKPVSYRSREPISGKETEAREAAAERVKRWREQLEHDAWVEHALHLVRDAQKSDASR